MSMTLTHATIYTQAALVFVAQLVVWLVEKNWGLVVAALACWALYHAVVLPEAGVFHAMVLGPEGLHATGQRVFGVTTR